MFRIQEFPDEVFPGRGKESPAPPESQRGHTPGSKQPDTPTAEVRSRIGSDTPSLQPEVQDEPGGAFRARSRSAPPILWAAMRYGRELRRMSDEFDVALQVSSWRPVAGMEKETIRCWGGFGKAKKTSSLTSEEPLQHPLEVLPRPKSAGTTSQLHQGNSWKEILQAWLGHRPARDALPRSSK